jgi:hypothetical protein
VALLKELPPKCRKGSNDNAFTGGFRLWDEAHSGEPEAIPIKEPAPGKN